MRRSAVRPHRGSSSLLKAASLITQSLCTKLATAATAAADTAADGYCGGDAAAVMGVAGGSGHQLQRQQLECSMVDDDDMANFPPPDFPPPPVPGSPRTSPVPTSPVPTSPVPTSPRGSRKSIAKDSFLASQLSPPPPVQRTNSFSRQQAVSRPDVDPATLSVSQKMQLFKEKAAAGGAQQGSRSFRGSVSRVVTGGNLPASPPPPRSPRAPLSPPPQFVFTETKTTSSSQQTSGSPPVVKTSTTTQVVRGGDGGKRQSSSLSVSPVNAMSKGASAVAMRKELIPESSGKPVERSASRRNSVVLSRDGAEKETKPVVAPPLLCEAPALPEELPGGVVDTADVIKRKSLQKSGEEVLVAAICCANSRQAVRILRNGVYGVKTTDDNDDGRPAGDLLEDMKKRLECRDEGCKAEYNLSKQCWTACRNFFDANGVLVKKNPPEMTSFAAERVRFMKALDYRLVQTRGVMRDETLQYDMIFQKDYGEEGSQRPWTHTIALIYHPLSKKGQKIDWNKGRYLWEETAVRNTPWRRGPSAVNTHGLGLPSLHLPDFYFADTGNGSGYLFSILKGVVASYVVTANGQSPPHWDDDTRILALRNMLQDGVDFDSAPAITATAVLHPGGSRELPEVEGQAEQQQNYLAFPDNDAADKQQSN